MGIDVDPEDLAQLTGRPVEPERFAAIDRAARKLIASVYTGDLDTASGRAADVLGSVWLAIATRLVMNPGGARTVGLGSANLTFGGQDTDVANPMLLSPVERAALEALVQRKTTRRASWVALHPSMGTAFDPAAGLS